MRAQAPEGHAPALQELLAKFVQRCEAQGTQVQVCVNPPPQKKQLQPVLDTQYHPLVAGEMWRGHYPPHQLSMEGPTVLKPFFGHRNSWGNAN